MENSDLTFGAGYHSVSPPEPISSIDYHENPGQISNNSWQVGKKVKTLRIIHKDGVFLFCVFFNLLSLLALSIG